MRLEVRRMRVHLCFHVFVEGNPYKMVRSFTSQVSKCRQKLKFASMTHEHTSSLLIHLCPTTD